MEQPTAAKRTILDTNKALIFDGIDDMHRTGKKASPLRLPQKEADVAEFRIRRDATENMLIII